MQNITPQIMTRISVEVFHPPCLCTLDIDAIIATACEVLARRIVHASPPDRITSMMSTRYTHRELDGDDSDKTSALEMAIDSHW